jgi:predicted kinase
MGFENKKNISTVFIVCGGCGAGKTTYSISLADRQHAVRFSIDPWMQTLFGPDQKELDFAWITERVERCSTQIWQIVEQLIKLGINVVLDFGFSKREERQYWRERILGLGAKFSIHFLDVPIEVRREQVHRRNQERDPALFAFEVTDSMFDFVEPFFQAPNDQELTNGLRITFYDEKELRP